MVLSVFIQSSSTCSPSNLSWICEVGCYQFLFSLSESFWDWTDWDSQYFKLGGGVLHSNCSGWIWVVVTSECSALLGWKLGFGGVSDNGFSSCTVPTYYCGSKYFYNQHPQVWNLIRTECSLNSSEHRVESKAS